MRYLSRLVIPLSMMVVVSAVAGKSARAQDGEKNRDPGGAVPALAPDAVDGDGAGASSESDAGPKRKRRSKSVEAEPAPADGRTRFGGPAERNHRLQTGLSIMPGTGYRLVVRYKETQSCVDPSGVASKPVCARRLPTFMDFQLAFGALDRMDIIVDLRFGLEKDPAATDSHQFAIAPGMRFWLDQEIALKFYSTLQFVYDYTYFGPRTSVASGDFGVRNANGLMYDPIRNAGFYLQFGETVGLRRWFRIDLDVGLGAQIRFP
jgi:hypothetical protein